jgi:hypothetical protein
VQRKERPTVRATSRAAPPFSCSFSNPPILHPLFLLIPRFLLRLIASWGLLDNSHSGSFDSFFSSAYISNTHILYIYFIFIFLLVIADSVSISRVQTTAQQSPTLHTGRNCPCSFESFKRLGYSSTERNPLESFATFCDIFTVSPALPVANTIILHRPTPGRMGNSL